MIDKIRERLQDVIDGIEIYTVGRLNTEKANISILQLQRFANELKKINQVEAEYKSKKLSRNATTDFVIGDEYCWQNCQALEMCGECKRLHNGNTDFYDNEEYNNGWIPCSERLPEKFDSVLVSCEGSVVGGTHEGEKCEFVATGYMFSKDHWQIQGHDDVKHIKVIAWQPLPQPPKGE